MLVLFTLVFLITCTVPSTKQLSIKYLQHEIKYDQVNDYHLLYIIIVENSIEGIFY